MSGVLDGDAGGLFGAVGGVYQVFHCLNVYLTDTHLSRIRPPEHLRPLNLLKDKLHTPRNDPLLVLPLATLHRIRLSRSGLPIGKNTHILPINAALNKLGELIEDLDLGASSVENALEMVLVLFELVFGFEVLFGDLQQEGAVVDDAVVRELVDGAGADAAVHSDIAAHLLQFVVEFLAELEEFIILSLQLGLPVHIHLQHGLLPLTLPPHLRNLRPLLLHPLPHHPLLLLDPHKLPLLLHKPLLSLLGLVPSTSPVPKGLHHLGAIVLAGELALLVLLLKGLGLGLYSFGEGRGELAHVVVLRDEGLVLELQGGLTVVEQLQE